MAESARQRFQNQAHFQPLASKSVRKRSAPSSCGTSSSETCFTECVTTMKQSRLSLSRAMRDTQYLLVVYVMVTKSQFGTCLKVALRQVALHRLNFNKNAKMSNFITRLETNSLQLITMRSNSGHQTNSETNSKQSTANLLKIKDS